MYYAMRRDFKLTLASDSELPVNPSKSIPAGPSPTPSQKSELALVPNHHKSLTVSNMYMLCWTSQGYVFEFRYKVYSRDRVLPWPHWQLLT
jgi:hypothetical protein